MKELLVLALVLTVSIVISAVPVEKKYSTKYDNIDLDEILTSERLFNNYMSCILDKGPCSPDGKLLKEAIPDALNNDCSKCSEKQKKGGEKVVKYIIENKKPLFDELEKKFDPKGQYRKKYQERLKKLEH